MLALDVDAPKPPTYPFIHSIFKERGHKTHSTPELRAYLPSCLQNFLTAFSAACRRFRSAFPHRFRFGEAVFRPGARNPQEKKAPNMTFSCQSLQNLGIFARPALREANYPPVYPQSQAISGP